LNLFFSIIFSIYSFIFSRKPLPSEGKSILVTGGASGIGKEIVFELVSRNCFVFAADINLKLLNETFGQNPNIRILKVDVCSPKDISDAVDAVKSTGKVLYGIVNCAGIGRTTLHNQAKGLAEMDIDTDIMPVYQVNTFGAMRIVTAFFSMILESKGSIVNITSIAGRVASIPVYSETKFALNSYSANLKRELKDFGVRVTAIEPGWVDTPLVSKMLSDGFLDTSKTMFKARFEESLKLAKEQTKHVIMSPKVVAKAVADTLFDPNPPTFKIVDRPLMVVIYTVMSLLPPFMGIGGLQRANK